MLHQPQKKQRRTQNHCHNAQQFPQVTQSFLQRRQFSGNLVNHTRNFAQFRVHARGRHNAFSTAFHNFTGHINHVSLLCSRKVRSHGCRCLCNRQGFSCKGRFIHGEPLYLQKAKVCGHLISGF